MAAEANDKYGSLLCLNGAVEVVSERWDQEKVTLPQFDDFTIHVALQTSGIDIREFIEFMRFFRVMVSHGNVQRFHRDQVSDNHFFFDLVVEILFHGFEPFSFYDSTSTGGLQENMKKLFINNTLLLFTISKAFFTLWGNGDVL